MRIQKFSTGHGGFNVYEATEHPDAIRTGIALSLYRSGDGDYVRSVLRYSFYW